VNIWEKMSAYCWWTRKTDRGFVYVSKYAS